MRSDALEGGEGYPAVVVADLDVGVADIGVADVAVLYSAPLLCLASPAPQPYALLLCIPAPPPCTPAPTAPTAVTNRIGCVVVSKVFFIRLWNHLQLVIVFGCVVIRNYLLAMGLLVVSTSVRFDSVGSEVPNRRR